MIETSNARLSELFVEQFLAHAPSAIAMFDCQMRYLMATDRWRSDYGLADQDIIGKGHYEIFPEIPEDWREMHRRTLNGETLSSDADPFPRADGSLDWVRWRNVPWYTGEGDIGGMVMFTEVITEEVMFRRAMEHAIEGVARIDAHGRVIFANDYLAILMNGEASDLLGTHWSDRIQREQVPALQDAMDRMTKSGKAQLDVAARTLDEQTVHLRVTLVADYARDASLAGYYVFVTSIDEEMRGEKLREKLWKVLVEDDLDPTARFRAVLVEATRFFGMSIGLISSIKNGQYEVLHAETPDNSIAPGQVFDFADTYCWHVYSANGPRAFHHVGDSEMREHPCYRGFGLEAYIGAPLFVDGMRFGTVNFSSPDPRERPFSSLEIQLVQQIAQWIGQELERAIHMETLRESEERFALAAQGSSVGIWDWMDIERDEEHWSDQFHELLGYHPDELTPSVTTFRNLLHPEDIERTFECVDRHLNQRVPFSVEYRLRCKNGEYRWFLGTGQAVWDADGKARRMIGSVMDIHDRKRAETLKSEFVSTVSHELRTPMTSILGSISLVQSGKFGEISGQARRLLEIATANGNRLLRLINDLLDIDKLDSGTPQFIFEPVELSELLSDAVAQNEAFVHDHGLKMRCATSDIEGAVRVDRDRILQVLTNLVSNAAKFGRDGGVIVLSAEDLGDKVRIFVIDDGPGIPTDKLEKIFERFVQVDGSDSRTAGGTGLGLSISRSIVDAHDSALNVTSELGAGTRFWFDLEKATLPAISPAEG